MPPYYKPKLLMMYLLVPVVAVISISFVIGFADSWLKFFKYSDQNADRVAYDTTDTAETANELLLQYSERLLEFDRESRKIFGLRHKWLDEGKRAETPESVFEQVQKSQDESLLKDYFELGTTREELEANLTKLEKDVDSTVSSIPPDATKERVFQAERIVRKKITNAIDQLELSFELLHNLEKRFKETQDD